MIELYPQNDMLKSLTLTLVNVILFGNRGPCKDKLEGGD